MKKITIHPVSRIAGHAKITIHLDDEGQVTFVPYQTRAGDALLMLEAGPRSADWMFRSAAAVDRVLTWILRAVGYVRWRPSPVTTRSCSNTVALARVNLAASPTVMSRIGTGSKVAVSP